MYDIDYHTYYSCLCHIEDDKRSYPSHAQLDFKFNNTGYT